MLGQLPVAFMSHFMAVVDTEAVRPSTVPPTETDRFRKQGKPRARGRHGEIDTSSSINESWITIRQKNREKTAWVIQRADVLALAGHSTRYRLFHACNPNAHRKNCISRCMSYSDVISSRLYGIRRVPQCRQIPYGKAPGHRIVHSRGWQSSFQLHRLQRTVGTRRCVEQRY